MDSEEIERRVSSLKLSTINIEESVIIPADLTSFGQQRLESCLVGKVLSHKAVNRDTFRSQMPRILQSKKQVNIEVIGENIYLLDFQSPIDRRHALLDGPWNFFKDLVVFQTPTGLQKVADLVFHEIPIWVQCHNIPLAFMYSKIVSNIGSKLGKVIEVDEGEDGRCTGRFARIRVLLDISKPLRQGIWVKTDKEIEDICILLLYERLPNFCFTCGKIGHVQRDCDTLLQVGTVPRFGNWLRAASVVGDKKNQVPKPFNTASSDTLSAPSTDENGNIEPQPLGSFPVLRMGTVASRENSAMDDNQVMVGDNHIPITDDLQAALRNDCISQLIINKEGTYCPPVDAPS